MVLGKVCIGWEEVFTKVYIYRGKDDTVVPYINDVPYEGYVGDVDIWHTSVPLGPTYMVHQELKRIALLFLIKNDMAYVHEYIMGHPICKFTNKEVPTHE